MLRGGRESRRRREGEKRDEDDPLRGGGETAQLACLFGNGPHPSLPPSDTPFVLSPPPLFRVCCVGRRRFSEFFWAAPIPIAERSAAAPRPPPLPFPFVQYIHTRGAHLTKPKEYRGRKEEGGGGGGVVEEEEREQRQPHLAG